MKIIHTSDWHLGHMLYNFSRDEEQSYMLKRIAQFIEEEKPDALLISGDIYDTTQPSAAAQTMFANALVEMHRANPGMHIVCIAGNHDSGSKHMIFHTPWKALDVHMIGNISKESNLNDYIIKIEGKGYIVAVPFATDRFMPDNIFTELQNIVEERNREEQLPLFLMAHLAIANSDFRGHELSTEENIGGLNCQEIEIFGKGYDYIALGHIHKRQQLDREGHIFYSGTPTAMSFDEVYRGNQHGVIVAECSSHGKEITTRILDINPIRPLVNIPQEGYATWEEVKREFRDYPDDIPSYIRLNVEVEKYLPSVANEEANQIAKEKACRFCLINSMRRESTATTGTVRNFTTSEFKQLDITDVAKMWIESKGDLFDDEIRAILEEVKQDIISNPERE